MNNQVCICIAGWHFPQEIFTSLHEVRGVDIFIISHKPKSEIPEYVYSLVPCDHVFVESNYGYDWGCYQQFLEKGVWRNYSHIVFMHDDIDIRRPDFIEAGLKLLERYKVIGNGRAALPQDWFESHPESFCHSSWRLTNQPLLFNVVRGSYFMTTKRSLEKLGCFEVFWDRLRAAPYFGNWSLRASCRKWQDRCGQECFGYLSDTPLESDWIIESVRGEKTDQIRDDRGAIDRIKSHIIYVLSKYYMQQAVSQSIFSKIIAHCLKIFLRYAATCPAS
jgi:hypothetical protein